MLVTSDPGITTLYLPDEELSLNTSSKAVTGTRYYSLNDQIVAARSGASSVAYLAGDQQDTSSVAIDAATLDVTRRYYDPYGNPRGSAPPSFPVGEKGFVGGADDSATTLTDLGAREYQPATGSFISADPVLKPYDPQDLNPYAYAQGNPATYADPNGTVLPGDNGCGVGNEPKCNPDPCDKYKNYDQHKACEENGGTLPGPTPRGTPKDTQACHVSADFSLPCNTPNLAQIIAAYRDASRVPLVWTWGNAPTGLSSYYNEIGALSEACDKTHHCPSGFKTEVDGLLKGFQTSMDDVSGGWKCRWLGVCDYTSVAIFSIIARTEYARFGGEAAPSAADLAAGVANRMGIDITRIKNGYKLLIPYGKNGIMIRVMEQGGGRTNYYRISIPGQETFTVEGAVSSDRALTHINIGSTSLEDIFNVLGRIMGDAADE